MAQTKIRAKKNCKKKMCENMQKQATIKFHSCQKIAQAVAPTFPDSAPQARGLLAHIQQIETTKF